VVVAEDDATVPGLVDDAARGAVVPVDRDIVPVAAVIAVGAPVVAAAGVEAEEAETILLSAVSYRYRRHKKAAI